MYAPPPGSRAQRLFADSGLGAAHEPIDVELLRGLLRRHYDLGGRLQPLSTEKDDTFRLFSGSADFLVKVSQPEEPQGVVELQTAAMRFLHGAAPHVPAQRVRISVDGRDGVVINTNEGGTRVLRVLGFIEGTLWAQTLPSGEQFAKLGQMLGRVDAALASFAHPADRRALVWDIRHFHEMTELLEHTSRTEHRRLARAVFRLFETTVVPQLDQLETQVIHGDYSPYNVVVDELSDAYVTGVIDFGDTMRSAKVFDPAVALANLIGRREDRPWRDAGYFVAGYEGVAPIPERDLVVLPTAALARLTLRALVTNWRANRVLDRRDYVLAHAKDDWVRLQRSIAVPMEEILVQLRTAPREHS